MQYLTRFPKLEHLLSAYGELATTSSGALVLLLNTHGSALLKGITTLRAQGGSELRSLEMLVDEIRKGMNNEANALRDALSEADV